MKSEARSHVKKRKKKKKKKAWSTVCTLTECMLEGNMKPKNKHFLT